MLKYFMSPFSTALIVTNNYSHDIATALLFVSGIMMWILSNEFSATKDGESELYFIGLHRNVTGLAKYSLIWVLAAGVPRITFYKEFEWSDMAGDLQIIAIIIKHIVMFLLVGTGIYYWHRLNRKAKNLIAKNTITRG